MGRHDTGKHHHLCVCTRIIYQSVHVSASALAAQSGQVGYMFGAH